MQKAFQIAQFLILLIVLSGCRIETAKPVVQKKLVIASDYLKESDTIMFRSFSKSTNTRITILPWKKSKIIGEFRNNNYNTGIDIIMMKSLYDVHDLQKRKLFQPLKLSDNLQEKYLDHSSERYDYFGFGYDPYIVAYPQNERSTIKMYNDLKRYKYIKDLNESDFIPMIAPILGKMKKTEAHLWIKRMYKHNYADSLLSDSLISRMPVLTNYSNFQKNRNSKLYKNKVILMPNSKSTGTFYNLRTIAIVFQAEHYNEALEFVDFHLSGENNVSLNKKMKTIAINSSEGGFRKYYVHSEEMVVYYMLIERSLNRFQDN